MLPTKRLTTFSDGSYFLENLVQPPPVPVLPQLYLALHDAQMGPLWRWHVPEVNRLEPGHSIPLNRDWQILSYALNLPGMLPEKWRVLYGYRTAFTNNGAGYDRPGDPPKQDWVNMRDLTARDLPKFDQPRICGGTLLKGNEGYSLTFALREAVRLVASLSLMGAPEFRSAFRALTTTNVLWVDYLDATKPPPAAEALPIWHKFVALNVRSDGLSRFPYRGGLDVWIPLIARVPVWYPLSRLRRLDMTKPLPDPYSL